jgi:hypothetical protein
MDPLLTWLAFLVYAVIVIAFACGLLDWLEDRRKE